MASGAEPLVVSIYCPRGDIPPTTCSPFACYSGTGSCALYPWERATNPAERDQPHAAPPGIALACAGHGRRQVGAAFTVERPRL